MFASIEPSAPAAMALPEASKTPVTLGSVAMAGSSSLRGCVQAALSPLSGRAMTLLWQLAQTVPGGV